MISVNRLWKSSVDTRELLSAIAAVGPKARAWSQQQPTAPLTVCALSALGMLALDAIPENEAVAVAELILGTAESLRSRSNAALLARAGLALTAGSRGFSLIRSLYKTFQEMNRVDERARPIEVLASLGNQLPVSDARPLLAFMAGLGQLDATSRQLAREGREADAPHPKLVFRALLGSLPESVSRGCSQGLRQDLLVVQLMTQHRPRPSFWQRLSRVLQAV